MQPSPVCLELELARWPLSNRQLETISRRRGGHECSQPASSDWRLATGSKMDTEQEVQNQLPMQAMSTNNNGNNNSGSNNNDSNNNGQQESIEDKSNSRSIGSLESDMKDASEHPVVHSSPQLAPWMSQVTRSVESSKRHHIDTKCKSIALEAHLVIVLCHSRVSFLPFFFALFLSPLFYCTLSVVLLATLFPFATSNVVVVSVDVRTTAAFCCL